MAERPYTLLSACMSIDGYIDDTSTRRLMLSNDADLDRVDAVRASCDAIFVGAATIRYDDPRLLVRDESRRRDRRSRGLEESPVKVTATDGVRLDADANFFTAGDVDKLVYCSSDQVPRARQKLGAAATVVDGGPHVEMRRVSEDLYARGVRRLMVEGGCDVLTQFLAADLVDDLQLVVAPFFVGNSAARRLVDDGKFPWNAGRPARLAETRPIGDVVLLRYALSSRFES